MMTARKKVGLLSTHRLAARHLVDYSSSDHFTSDDSSRDSSSSSSSETSSDSSADAISDSSSGHSSSNHSSPTLQSGMRSSHQLCSSVLSIPYSSAAITERPCHSTCAGPSHKRIRSSDSVTDLEISSGESSESSVPRETGSRVDVDVGGSDEPYSEPNIDLEILGLWLRLLLERRPRRVREDADALRDIRVDARVVVEAIDREETKTGMRGLVEVRVDRVTHLVVADDIPEPTQEGVVEVTYETLGDLVQRFHDHTVEILVRRVQLERDNRRLRDMMDVASQRVVRSQHRELRVQREMRQIWRFRFYDRIRIARLEAYARRHLGYHS
ncbi:hypothetical protein Tco_0736914 [Tanacetum coccineum]